MDWNCLISAVFAMSFSFLNNKIYGHFSFLNWRFRNIFNFSHIGIQGYNNQIIFSLIQQSGLCSIIDNKAWDGSVWNCSPFLHKSNVIPALPSRSYEVPSKLHNKWRTKPRLRTPSGPIEYLQPRQMPSLICRISLLWIPQLVCMPQTCLIPPKLFHRSLAVHFTDIMHGGDGFRKRYTTVGVPALFISPGTI